LKTICVFCGSRSGNDPRLAAAAELGTEMQLPPGARESAAIVARKVAASAARFAK
jgi:predicted Rossmann-fold nucleotide-binding protein